MWGEVNMKSAYHGICTSYGNILTDVHLAHEAGYDAMEFLAQKLMRYLENGGTTKALRSEAERCGIQPAIVNAFVKIAQWQPDQRPQMLEEAERYTRIAVELGCSTVMILPLFELNDAPYNQAMEVLTNNIGAISEIGRRYGIRYQIELVAYTPLRTLEQGLQIIRDVGNGNLGLVIDFWHLHAAGINTPADVARMDKDLIYDVHFCDGRQPHLGEAWTEEILRAYRPGEGEVDVRAWTDAVLATGYDGYWAPELIHPALWEMDAQAGAKLYLENMRQYVEKREK